MSCENCEESAYVIDKLAKLLAEIAVIVNGPEPPLTSWSYHDLPAKVRALKEAQQPAALAEPLFLLHTGAVYSGERDDWEIEANSGDAVDAYCDAHPGKTVGLYLATPAQQPAAAVPADTHGDEFGRGWNACRAAMTATIAAIKGDTK